MISQGESVKQEWILSPPLGEDLGGVQNLLLKKIF
jgi:hypothetical protein